MIKTQSEANKKKLIVCLFVCLNESKKEKEKKTWLYKKTILVAKHVANATTEKTVIQGAEAGKSLAPPTPAQFACFK